ncbi:hypothetical protein CEE45_15900 [Candidatus Heimdallarchaeota archaeon B3_Heim]|nr:MAG: hypothetical protein CEE45_15900 [Candidatus Heimdallarchaeota archaeon B3_Heim]
MIRITETIEFYRYLGIAYFTIAIFGIYFTTDLYWWPEGGPGVTYDWVQFPTGLMFLSPLFLIWGLICLKLQALDKLHLPSTVPSKKSRKKAMIIPFLTSLLLLLVSVSSSHILSTMRFRDNIIHYPTFFACLLLYFVFVFLSGLFLFFLDRFSRLDQMNLLKLMKQKNLVVLLKLGLILIPSVLAFDALLSVSFTRNHFQILVFVDGDLDVLAIFSTSVLPIFLGVVGIHLAFTELLPLFPLFFLLCTSFLVIELLFL